jgi:3-hydroxyacyl-[acyl-carrier-protein] dehydratase
MLLNKKQVMNFLPHRDPFLFVDSVSRIDFESNISLPPNPTAKDLVGGVVTGHFYVDPNLEVLKGHFPGNPILPGVIQAEMMAQVACLLNTLSVSNESESSEVDIALLGVDRSRFRKPILPEMHLTIISKLVRVRATFLTYECKIYHQDQLMSEADVFASFKFIKE